MKKKIILIGGGGHCKSCIDVIEAGGIFTVASIVDVRQRIGDTVLGYRIDACDDALQKLVRRYRYCLITIGQIKSPRRRMALFAAAQKMGAQFPAIISPAARVSPHAVIGAGTIILHGALVNAGAVIGANCIINTGALVEHDAYIGDHSHIATRAVINGGVRVGHGSFVGSGVVTKEYITIGAQSVIAAGLRVMHSVPAGRLLRK